MVPVPVPTFEKVTVPVTVPVPLVKKLRFLRFRFRFRFHNTAQRYGSGSGYFHYQAKIVKKTLISTVLRLLYDFLPMKNDVNVPSQSNNQKNVLEPSVL